MVHEYGKTDYTIVYEIITDGLNQLEDVLHKIQ
ncbi:MAG: HepT-like ribonuclease domain-containing protein [Candidatus Enteromonas sp.]